MSSSGRAQASPAPIQVWQTGDRFFVNGQDETSTTAAILDGNARAMQFYLPGPLSLTSMGCETTVGGTAGSLTRLGIFRDAGGYPGGILLDMHTLDSTAVGVLEVPNVGPFVVPTGFYWAVIAQQGGAATPPTYRSCGSGSKTYSPLLAINGSVPAVNKTGLGYPYTGIGGLLPANLPAISPMSGLVPRMHLVSA